MTTNKSYYYFKLKDTFFEDDAMLVLEKLPDGAVYTTILLKLALASLKTEGQIAVDGDYPAAYLAHITRHTVSDIEKALKVFLSLDLITVTDDGAFLIAGVQNQIGRSSEEADRIREYRKKTRKKAPEKAAKKPGANRAKGPANRTNVTNKRTNVQNGDTHPRVKEKELRTFVSPQHQRTAVNQPVKQQPDQPGKKRSNVTSDRTNVTSDRTNVRNEPVEKPTEKDRRTAKKATLQSKADDAMLEIENTATFSQILADLKSKKKKKD